MLITQQLALMPLILISSLAFTARAIPHEWSVTDLAALSERDDTANYVVYPKDTQNQGQAANIYSLLKGVVPDPTKIFNSTTDNGSQHWFWAVPLTSANAEKVRGDPNIATVVRECTSNCGDPTASDDIPSSKTRRSDDSIRHKDEFRLVKRDGKTVNAHKADKDVAFISLPLGRQLGEDFIYDDTAGTGQTVYIVDTGAGLGNADEFSKYVAQNKRYLQARGATPNDGLENDIRKDGHGTGVLAKAVGWKHGVAKRSKPVIVRIADKSDPAAWLNGVQEAYDDWLPIYDANRKTATAVLNLSWGWTREGLSGSLYDGLSGDVWIAQLELLLNKCVGIGLLPIAPSGNGNGVVDQWPQLSAYPSNGNPPAVPNMMVIGGVTVDGERSRRSRPDPPGTNPPVITLYAPSSDLNIPQPAGGWRVASGLSYASGTIAGLGTYFLGLSSLSGNLANDDPVQRVIRLKQQLGLGSSLARGSDPNVRSVWNLADPETCPPGTLPPDFQDGDEVPCKDTSTTSGNTVIAIPGCYIMTPSAMPSLGNTAPFPQCSCTGGVIAGINSGTVSGTTYSWCATGGLPSSVPRKATARPPAQPTSQATTRQAAQPPAQPASQATTRQAAQPPAQPTSQATTRQAAQPPAQPTSQAPAPGPTQSCFVAPEPGLRGNIRGYTCRCNIGPTPTATVISKEYTCPTKPPGK